MQVERIQTLGKVPWEDGMTLGSGYDIEKLQLARSPFDTFDLEYVTDSSRLENFKLASQTIETTEALHMAVKVCAGTSTPVLSVGNVNAASQYLSKIKINAKNIATIVSCSYTWPEETYDPEDPPDLTDEASDVLEQRKPEAFSSRYGQHFIAGRICQSSFTAIYTHSAIKEEDLTKFKQKLMQSKMDLTESVTELDQVAMYTEIAKSSNVTTRVQVFVSGVDDSIGLHASTKDVVPALKHFIEESHKPLPHIALLKHYTLAIPQIPRPYEPWFISDNLWMAFERLTVLEVRARSHSLLSAQRMIPSLSELSRELGNMHQADPSWKSSLKEWFGRYMEQFNLLETYNDRARILGLMRSAKSSDEWPKKWTDAGKTKEWRCGLSPREFGDFESDARRDVKTFEKPETPWPECQEESLRHEYNDRIIVGARIESLRTDGLNGSWKVVDGSIGKSSLEVRFSTTHHRWGKYLFEVWSLDRGLYAEEV